MEPLPSAGVSPADGRGPIRSNQTTDNMKTKAGDSRGIRRLLEDQLADTYYAEKQLLKALPKMAKAATNDELRSAFTAHFEETKGQLERLEQVFELMDLPAKGKTCPAILGIVQECTELMEEFADDEALDAALVAGGRKAEHYEIATYSNLIACAEHLGLNEVVGLLQETLDQEKGADDTLSELGGNVMELEAEAERDGRDSKGAKGSSMKASRKMGTDHRQ